MKTLDTSGPIQKVLYMISKDSLISYYSDLFLLSLYSETGICTRSFYQA